MRKIKEKKLIRLAHLFAALILTLSILVPSFVEVGSSVWTANSAIAAESTADLADKQWINSLDIETKQNGQWVAYAGSKPLPDGSNVTVDLTFDIPMGSLTGTGSKLTYQFPDGFKIDKEQKGDFSVNEENGSSKVIGTYTISTDGKVEITFNENFDPKIAYPDSHISVSGTLENSSSSSEKTLNFPGSGTTIKIEKKDNGDTDHDIKVEKHGTVADDKKSVSYTVKVTTTKGTPDTVNLEDTLTYVTNATGHYDKGSFKIVKKDASGQKTELSTSQYQPTISTNSGNQATFKIAGLPKLDKGESYEITYSVKIDPKDGTTGEESIGNSVHAKSKDKEDWGGDYEKISNRLIHKWGNYNNGQIDWTIYVNEAQADISHYQLTDSLPDNASLLDDIKLVDTSTGEKYDISSLIVKGKKGDKEISIDFSKLPDKYKKDIFRITYTTKAPEASDKSVDVKNSVAFHDSTHHYSDSTSVTVPAVKYGIEKKFDGDEAISGNSEEKRYNWHSTFKLSGKELDTLDYTDSIQKATSTNEHDSTAKEQDEESHYGVASELYKELTDPDKQKLLVEEGSRVTTYDLGTEYEVKLEFFDKDKKQIDKTDSKTPVRSFRLRVVPKDGKTIKPTKFVIHYSTHANIGKVNPGETWTYKNVGDFSYFNNEQIAERGSDSHSYKQDCKLVKQASLTGGNGSYQGVDQTADFDKTDGTIYYRILLTIPKDSTGKIDVTDILPKGMTYEDGSLEAAFYGNEYWTYSKQDWWDGSEHTYDLAGDQKPNVSTTKQADGTIKLNVVLPDGYRSSDSSHIIQLTYKASVKDDETWQDMNNTKKSYTNTVSWNGYTDQQTTTETREVSVLKKKGVQIKDAYGNPTKVVGYQVDINPQGKDLNRDGDTVVLNDQLSLPEKGMDAYLDLQKTKLYKYDPKTEKHIGDEIDHSLYSLKYDSDTHQIKLELPDKTACVLVYQYSIDTDNYTSPTISNKASLAGQCSSNESTQLTDSSSSAYTTEQKISVYKVDSDDYTKNLPGTEFSLEKLDGSSWKEVEAKDVNFDGKLVTDKNGKLDLTNLANNTVYRLKEREAPSGYSLNSNYYYLVWLNGKKTSSEIYNGLSDTVKKEIGKQSNIHFFKTAGGAIYVPDDYSQLTVTKHWINSDGTAAKPGASSVKVDLYRVTKKLNAVKVKVKVVDGWNQTKLEKEYPIAKGGSFAIDWGQWGMDSQGFDWINVNGISQTFAKNDTSFTLSAVNSDTTIQIKTKGWANAPAVKYQDPQPMIDQSTKTKVETVTLDASNNWQKTWNNLPHEDEYGNTYDYYVEEESVPGYKTSYRNNDGIKYGQIDVINQEKNEFYHLPQSGGRGLYALLVLGTAIVASCLAFRRKKFN